VSGRLVKRDFLVIERGLFYSMPLATFYGVGRPIGLSVILPCNHLFPESWMLPMAISPVASNFQSLYSSVSMSSRAPGPTMNRLNTLIRGSEQTRH